MKPRILSADRRTAYEQLAAIALQAGSIAEGLVEGQKVLAVPDVILVEYAAQGLSLPPAPGVQTEDGRTVRFYALPEPRVIA